jgi:hypothetical protein
MSGVRFEPTNPVFEQVETVYALDQAATVICFGLISTAFILITSCVCWPNRSCTSTGWHFERSDNYAIAESETADISVFNMGQSNSHGTQHSHDLATCIDVSLQVVMNVNIDRTGQKIAKRLMVSSLTQLSV